MKKPNSTNSTFMNGFTESYLADLGRVVAAWSHVEQQFLLLFLSVVVMKASSGSTSDPRVQKLMGLPLGDQLREFRKRLNQLEIPPNTLDATKRVLDRIANIRKARDEVAHSVFNISLRQGATGEVEIVKDESVALFKSWKNAKPMESTVVKQTELKSLFEKIHVLFWDLVSLSLDPNLRSHRERNPGIETQCAELPVPTDALRRR